MRSEDLRRLALFSGLSNRELEILAGLLRERKVDDGQVLLEQGSRAGGVFIVLAGKVRVDRVLPDGSLARLAFMGPGSLFGVMALLDDGPRAARCTAAGSCRVAALDREDFRQLMDGLSALDLRFQLAVLGTLFNDIRRTNLVLADAVGSAGGSRALRNNKDDKFGSLS